MNRLTFIPDGIIIEGKRLNLVVGRVTGFCNSNVIINGSRHNVVKVTVEADILENVFGFEIRGNNNQLVGNAALNMQFSGFAALGDGNRLVGNRAENNSTGIEIFNGGQDNILTRNTALNNRFVDLLDNNVDCDNNQWVNNIFNTRNEECIQ